MSQRTQPCHCLNCGHLVDAVSVVGDEEPTATPGDFTVCLYCGHVMALDDKLQLRELTDAEMIEVAGNPELLEVQRLVAAWRKDNEGRREQRTDASRDELH